ncbi:MAG: hypothetical protein NVV74_14445 [Magnetospirillum sp.]|nr:hypothetical protein [Magnetospirillum sp.]
MSDISSTSTASSSLAQTVQLSKTSAANGTGSLLGSSSNLAMNLAQAQAAAARPAFNLQFNSLQNAIIDRMNAKINELNASNGHKALDDQLKAQRQAFVQLGTDVEPVRAATLSSYHALNAIAEALAGLNNQVGAAAAGDSSIFNQTLAGINDLAANLKIVDATPIGIVVSDGTEKLKRDGVLMVTQPDGTQVKATSYEDFGSSTEALMAITAALGRVFNVQDANQNRADIIATTMNNVQVGINKIDAQMAAQEQLDLAKKAAEVAKIKQQYSFTLQALSLSFESSQSMADALTARLNSEMSVDKGSVMSLFT